MKRAYNFCAGPATLPEEVLLEAQSEFLNWKGYGASVLEMGHRSSEVEALMMETEQRFRDVLSIPDAYSVIMIGGAGRSNFGMIPLNFLSEQSVGSYIISGIWSKMAYEEAVKLKSASIVASSEDIHHRALPTVSAKSIPSDAKYLYYTSNETVNGTQFSLPPKADIPLVCDMTSSLLSEPIAFERYGLIFAGAQKNIAQAGMSAVIISNDFLDTIDENAIIPTMMDYRVHVKSKSLYATPPVFNCYIANKVLQWVENNGGIPAFVQRNSRKAMKLYEFIDNSSFYSCKIDSASRSVMNVCFALPDSNLDNIFVTQAEKKGLLALKGHRAVGGMRASIYNAMPEEGVDALIAFMQFFEKENTQ